MEIDKFVMQARSCGRAYMFRSKFGGISVAAITKNIDKEILRVFSIKEIRNIVALELKSDALQHCEIAEFVGGGGGVDTSLYDFSLVEQ